MMRSLKRRESFFRKERVSGLDDVGVCRGIMLVMEKGGLLIL